MRQQRLPAWQPILDAKTVIPIFASISLLFVPVGIVLIITSNSGIDFKVFRVKVILVKEWAQYYDVACENQLSLGSKNCVINISLEEDFLVFKINLLNFYFLGRRLFLLRIGKLLSKP